MSQSLWIAKTGLDAQQTKMATISNNLANVGTNGFKRGRGLKTCSIKTFAKLELSHPKTLSCHRVYKWARVPSSCY